MQDIELQDRLLPGVSRTFGLTIPQLPAALRTPITNAYLLCRVADTIEDSERLTAGEKAEWQDRFVAIVADREEPARFSRELSGILREQASPAERRLVAELPGVISVTRALNARQRAALLHCIGVMCDGMSRFQRVQGPGGLASLAEMDDYCFHVAGVVGEMLTEMFCDHAPEIDCLHEELQCRARSFGQGLQMTNILKDIWEDRGRGACWLPRDVFLPLGCELEDLDAGCHSAAFGEGLGILVGIAHGHLKRAVEYALIIPADHKGIRRFCLWAVGLALMTLRKIYRRPDFTHAGQVKVRRSAVRLVAAAMQSTVSSNWMQAMIFGMLGRGLPSREIVV